jgi:hypothetical protein
MSESDQNDPFQGLVLSGELNVQREERGDPFSADRREFERELEREREIERLEGDRDVGGG